MFTLTDTQQSERERGLRLADVLPAWCFNRDRIKPRRDPYPNVNMRGSNGMMAIHIAATEGTEDDIRVVLRDGANVNGRVSVISEDAGYTALHYAVIRSDYAMVRILLKNRARVNVRSYYGTTPLHIAAGIDNPKIVSTLLKHGANVYAEYTYPQSERFIPLHYAMKAGLKSNVRLLLDAGADKKYQPLNPKYADSTFRVAATLDDNTILGYVLMWFVDFGKKCSKKDVMREVESNEAIYTDIAQCVSGWLFASFRTLSSDILIPGIMHAAAELRSGKIIEYFLKRGIKVNEIRHPLHTRVPDATFGYTLLHTAASRKRNDDLVKMLIKYGADVNAVDVKGRVPVDLAMRAKDYDTFQVLIKSGTRPRRVIEYYV